MSLKTITSGFFYSKWKYPTCFARRCVERLSSPSPQTSAPKSDGSKHGRNGPFFGDRLIYSSFLFPYGQVNYSVHKHFLQSLLLGLLHLPCANHESQPLLGHKESIVASWRYAHRYIWIYLHIYVYTAVYKTSKGICLIHRSDPTPVSKSLSMCTSASV